MTGDGQPAEETGTSANGTDSGAGVAADDRPGPGESGTETGAGESDAQLPDGMRLRGEVVAVERVPAAEVPESFPVAVRSGEVLALSLTFARHDGQARTYFAHAGERLAHLLAVHGVDEPDQLEGRGVLVDIVAGHPVPVSVDEPRRGDARAVYGVIAGLAPSITIALFSFFGLGDVLFSPVYAVVYLVGTFLVLPVAIYVDAWYLRTTTDWGGRPLRWALLSVVPPLYVVVAPYYLIARENARPLAVGTSSAS